MMSVLSVFPSTARVVTPTVEKHLLRTGRHIPFIL
jgi:hypothetical protein